MKKLAILTAALMVAITATAGNRSRIFVAIHEDAWNDPAQRYTIAATVCGATKGFFSIPQLMAAGEDGKPAGEYPWHSYEALADNVNRLNWLAAWSGADPKKDPPKLGNWYVVNIDEVEAGVVGVLEHLAAYMFQQVKAKDLPDVEFDAVPDPDRTLERLYGITPVVQEPIEGETP